MISKIKDARLQILSNTRNNIDRISYIQNCSDNVQDARRNYQLSKVLDESNENEISNNTVILNVYDLDSISGSFNRLTRIFELGAFHAGVEVYGIEYCYGLTTDGSSGLTVNMPRQHPTHIYRESITMGRTKYTRNEVKLLITRLKYKWPGSEYNIFRRNCLNFADEFCQILEVGTIPNYVRSLPDLVCKAGDSIDRAVDHLTHVFNTLVSTCSNINSPDLQNRLYSRQDTKATVTTQSGVVTPNSYISSSTNNRIY
ncbi:uncharacterized protein CMU_009680 [Cryptosporidium muris RN66]|uniref:PPPDE domain-containing protein n=1 Tax=Cryptosporidium muris (strain RN66) TaxID=441375 RepID=B6AE35_CRYMR|nr:uncharacterized protein CMU_009680 [Cryptosporidium muris RN66]EEA06476.1 hypothetical protein, conserved [Cryptosporidium muris RN66]|eukprot:XP_002140825.1 hypothetical protein [Cryptosporidium muris RN66]